MANHLHYWLFIFLLFLVSYLPRIIPLLALKNREISVGVQRWLSFIPVSIFSALISADIFFWEGQFSLNIIENVKLIPSLIVLFVSFKIKNLFVSMIVGVLAISLMIYFT